MATANSNILNSIIYNTLIILGIKMLIEPLDALHGLGIIQVVQL